jgi:hypothetical protein
MRRITNIKAFMPDFISTNTLPDSTDALLMDWAACFKIPNNYYVPGVYKNASG